MQFSIEIGNLKLAIGNWQFEIGNSQFAIGNGKGREPQSESDKDPLLLDHHGSQQSIEFY